MERVWTLVDTPGHADFSTEMERVLQVLDYVVLIISAADGVTGQVRTLWRLLDHYQVPAFLFVNKMDQSGADREAVYAQIICRRPLLRQVLRQVLPQPAAHLQKYPAWILQNMCPYRLHRSFQLICRRRSRSVTRI